jgi:hypothetical protein
LLCGGAHQKQTVGTPAVRGVPFEPHVALPFRGCCEKRCHAQLDGAPCRARAHTRATALAGDCLHGAVFWTHGARDSRNNDLTRLLDCNCSYYTRWTVVTRAGAQLAGVILSQKSCNAVTVDMDQPGDQATVRCGPQNNEIPLPSHYGGLQRHHPGVGPCGRHSTTSTAASPLQSLSSSLLLRPS